MQIRKSVPGLGVGDLFCAAEQKSSQPRPKTNTKQTKTQPKECVTKNAAAA